MAPEKDEPERLSDEELQELLHDFRTDERLHELGLQSANIQTLRNPSMRPWHVRALNKAMMIAGYIYEGALNAVAWALGAFTNATTPKDKESSGPPAS